MADSRTESSRARAEQAVLDTLSLKDRVEVILALIQEMDLGVQFDAEGQLADRDQYDGEEAGFTFLDTDAGQFYILLETGGTWSEGFQFTGTKGDPGENIELRATATDIEWRVVGDATWNNLIAIDDISGREVELQVTATHIQWRYVGEASWTNLIALSDLEGPKGDIGINWQGDWTAGQYQERDAVAHNGSSWFANTVTSQEPTPSATDWDLIAEEATEIVNVRTVSAEYTITNEDLSTLIIQEAAENVIIPSTVLPIGGSIIVTKNVGGSVSVVAGAGVTFLPDDNGYEIPEKWTFIPLIQVSANTWSVQGTISDNLQNLLDAKADLVTGKIPTSQLPTLSLTETIEVADETARLALTSEQAEGKIVVQIDTGESWGLITGEDPSLTASWIQVGDRNVIIGDVDGLQAALDGKEPADSTILKEGDVEDSLTSTSTVKPLSANQGKQLEDTKRALQSAPITISVGTGGDYATLNDALIAASRLYPLYANGGVQVEIRLLTGFALNEDIVLQDIDLSFVTLTSVDATVSANPGSESLNLFEGINAKMFKLDCVIDMAATGQDGFNLSSSQLLVRPNAGIINAGRDGVRCLGAARADISLNGDFSGAAGSSFSVQSGGTIIKASGVSGTDSQTTNIWTSNGFINDVAGVAVPLDDKASLSGATFTGDIEATGLNNTPIENSPIGASSPNTGKFSSLIANDTLSVGIHDIETGRVDVAAGNSIDISVGGFATGILCVTSDLLGSGNNNTEKVIAFAGGSAGMSFSTLLTHSESTPMPFSVTSPSAGTIRITNDYTSTVTIAWGVNHINGA